MATTMDRGALLEKVDELILQATKEKSHYYVGSVLRECKAFIESAKVGLSMQPTTNPATIQSAPKDRHLYLHHKGKIYHFEPNK